MHRRTRSASSAICPRGRAIPSRWCCAARPRPSDAPSSKVCSRNTRVSHPHPLRFIGPLLSDHYQRASCPHYPRWTRTRAAAHSPAIRFITSVDQGVNELPFLLADPISAPPPLPSSSSPSTTSPLGTHNFTRPPICVIFGGAWDSDMISAMRAACRERGQGVRSVPWLRPDLDKPAPPLGPAYGKAMVERVRAALQKMRDKGVTGDQVIWF